MKKILKIVIKLLAIYFIFSAGMLTVHMQNEYETKQAFKTYGTDDFFNKHYLNHRRSFKGVPKIKSTDKQLVDLGKALGLKHIDKVAIVTESQGGASGNYHDGQRIIYISKNQPEKNIKETLAHEYLHFVWFEHETLLSNDNQLQTELIKLFLNNNNFHNWIDANYIKKNKYHPSELFSIACTELKDDQLEPYTLSQCNKWVDRSKLPIATEDKHF